MEQEPMLGTQFDSEYQYSYLVTFGFLRTQNILWGIKTINLLPPSCFLEISSPFPCMRGIGQKYNRSSVYFCFRMKVSRLIITIA